MNSILREPKIEKKMFDKNITKKIKNHNTLEDMVLIIAISTEGTFLRGVTLSVSTREAALPKRVAIRLQIKKILSAKSKDETTV